MKHNHLPKAKKSKKLFWQTLATGAAIGLVAYAICKDILRKDQK